MYPWRQRHCPFLVLHWELWGAQAQPRAQSGPYLFAGHSAGTEALRVRRAQLGRAEPDGTSVPHRAMRRACRGGGEEHKAESFLPQPPPSLPPALLSRDSGRAQ